MCHSTRIVKHRQLGIRREMGRRGISLTQVAQDSGVPLPSISTYFPANRDADPAMIPMAVVFALVDTQALPEDLLSQLLPDGVQFVRASDEIDHNAIAALCIDYLADLNTARHPESEAGEAIGPKEGERLDSKVTAIGGGK